MRRNRACTASRRAEACAKDRVRARKKASRRATGACGCLRLPAVPPRAVPPRARAPAGWRRCCTTVPIVSENMAGEFVHDLAVRTHRP